MHDRGSCSWMQRGSTGNTFHPTVFLGLSVIVGTWKPRPASASLRIPSLQKARHIFWRSQYHHTPKLQPWTFFSSQLPGTHQPFTIPEMDPHEFMYVLCPKSWAVHQLQSREHCLPSGAQKFTDTTMANNELLNIWAKINWNHPIYVFNTINDSWSQQNKHDTISYD